MFVNQNNFQNITDHTSQCSIQDYPEIKYTVTG